MIKLSVLISSEEYDDKVWIILFEHEKCLFLQDNKINNALKIFAYAIYIKNINKLMTHLKYSNVKHIIKIIYSIIRNTIGSNSTCLYF